MNQSMTSYKMASNSMFIRTTAKKDTYLDNLDDFLNDNLRTIADLISIKKGLVGDIKTMKTSIE
jgi:hypothetical protein